MHSRNIRKWAFKHPTPADLFRTMEDASGEDLDWFWKDGFTLQMLVTSLSTL
ncbi:MAG: hypothetical protein IPP89_00495 [Saprospiraceae bacterium]|nr:hypothetical protein [Candidatus Brachybacter algidus]MBL0117488.1 hypothetical protein [Candidatus Brachybacter algidus]